MGVRGLLRRLWSDRLTSGAVAIAVILALMLLAAGPEYSDAVSVAAMRRSVTDVPSGDATIEVEIRGEADAYPELDRLASDEIVRATAAVGTEITRTIVSGSSFEVGRADADLVDVAELAWIESIEQHATIVDGSWPTDGGSSGDSDTVAVAVDHRVADTFGLAVGDTLVLPPRSSGASPVTITVVGAYRIDDPSEPYWHGRDRFAVGVSVSGLFRSARFVVPRSTMVAGITRRTTASWLSIPRFDRLELDDVEPVRRRVLSLSEGLEDVRLRFGDDVVGDFEVDTVVPTLLAGSARSLTVARSAVFAVITQFALLAGYTLVLVAGLTVDARTAESAVFRVRGASARQLLGAALLEAAILVVPAALVAPRLASWTLRGFDEFGPLASIGLQIDPQPVGGAWVAVGGAALATIALLAWPAYRSARRAEQSDHRHARQRLRTGWQRAGLDVAVLAMALVAYWQLASLGDERAASVRGRFGVDPLVIVAPTFGLLAGALLALRVIPALGRLVERTVASSRGVAGALAGWQLARRPTRYARAGLLVILAVAIGTFSAAYEATWTSSQAAQAEHQVGADIRVSPNRRTGDSISDLHLVAAHEAVDGVRRSMPVLRRDVDPPGTDRPAVMLALDADRAVVDDPALAAALPELATRRPPTVGVELPTGVTVLEVTTSLTPVEDHDAGPLDVVAPVRGDLIVTVSDATGLLHRLDLGVLLEAEGPETLTADLTLQGPGGDVVAPIDPLTIVDMEFRTTPQQGPARTVQLEIGPVVAAGPGGSSEADLSGVTWHPMVTRLQFMADPPTLELVDADRTITALLGTGSSQVPTPVFFGIGVVGNSPPRALPAIATRSWLRDAGIDIGDSVPVERISSDTTTVEIVAVVESVPTVDPGRAEALVVDLATLHRTRFDPGQSIADVTEHWLRLDADIAHPAVEAVLGDAPVEAIGIMVADRRRAELTSDPPALGAIGAMTLGFVAASVFALVGFVLTTVVSARERRVEFALLRALGLSMRQLRRWTLLEQMALIVAAVLFGTAVGVALAAAVLPIVSLTQTGAGVFPPVDVVFPWATIVGLQAVLVGALTVGVLAVHVLVRNIATSTMLRAGGDT